MLMIKPLLSSLKKYPKAWNNWVKINNKLCNDPFMVDASNHMMIVVRKK